MQFVDELAAQRQRPCPTCRPDVGQVEDDDVREAPRVRASADFYRRAIAPRIDLVNRNAILEIETESKRLYQGAYLHPTLGIRIAQ